MRALRRDGGEIPVELTVWASGQRGQRSLNAFVRDVTERRRADAAVRQAKQEAERANRAKSEFLSRMSHDLRTPLNAILGFAQLLGAERLSDGQLECVHQIFRGGQHLLGLINEILDTARIEAGHLSLSREPVGVADIVRHVTELVTPLAAARKIALVVEDGATADRAVLADRQRLSQILLNLLANAVKYNRAAGRVTVSFEELAGDRVRINVTDTGAGIPAEKLAVLFRPFERLGAEASGVEGTGLGLTLSRRLAEAMKGAIGVRSEVDRGSTFWVELEATDERAVPVMPAADVRPLPAATSDEPATVLYIEDNVSNVRLMARLLAQRPMLTLVHAPDGLGGLRLAREQRPDVIFLDLHLPDATGEDVLRQLWDDPALRPIPVIVLSADATPGQIRRTLASGARAYLPKPLDLYKVLDVLDSALRSALERRRATIS
jgi:signal transduction histidine kinase/CheY-like chemotaxis protein